MSRPGARLAWHARNASRRFGVPGAIGVGLLAASLLFYATAVLPVARDRSALTLEIAEAESARESLKAGARGAATNPAQQLAQFYRFFPSINQALDGLAVVHAIAAIHAVQLEQGSYRMVRDRGTRLWLYEVTLPVKGDYPQLRRFLSQVLTDIPHLTLDSVTFQRQKAADGMLESQIKFTLFFAEAP